MPTFAALGHQESWDQIRAVLGGMRPEGSSEISMADLRSLIPWIPPRTVSRFTISAPCGSASVDGVFIDTFISPDELVAGANRRVVAKVRDAIRVAEMEGASLVTLGGFTSILLEADIGEATSGIPMTTGNTLTAALIIRGVEHAMQVLRRDLSAQEVLVIGATGDVGSACARSLNGRVRKLLLCARNPRRLEREASSLACLGAVEWSTDIAGLLRRATVIIAAASTPEPTFSLKACRDDAIICDAGYPKNIAGVPGQRLFWGGMGTIDRGFRSREGNLERFYRFPAANAAHGCILEGAVLTLSGRFESFSIGRGRIKPDRIEDMWRLASGQGVRLAPLFNGAGLWPEELVAA